MSESIKPTAGAYQVRKLVDVYGLPTPEQARRLVILLKLAEPKKKGEADANAA